MDETGKAFLVLHLYLQPLCSHSRCERWYFIELWFKRAGQREERTRNGRTDNRLIYTYGHLNLSIRCKSTSDTLGCRLLASGRKLDNEKQRKQTTNCDNTTFTAYSTTNRLNMAYRNWQAWFEVDFQGRKWFEWRKINNDSNWLFQLAGLTACCLRLL